jgi:hypothetical protein
MQTTNRPESQATTEPKDKTRRDSALAIWVHATLGLCFAGLLWLAVRETNGRLTIISLLYFLGASALLLLTLRLWSGRLCDSAERAPSPQAEPHSVTQIYDREVK